MCTRYTVHSLIETRPSFSRYACWQTKKLNLGSQTFRRQWKHSRSKLMASCETWVCTVLDSPGSNLFIIVQLHTRHKLASRDQLSNALPQNAIAIKRVSKSGSMIAVIVIYAEVMQAMGPKDCLQDFCLESSMRVLADMQLLHHQGSHQDDPSYRWRG